MVDSWHLMMQLQDATNNPFARSMQDLEERFYVTFPAARVAMMQKLENGWHDPLTGCHHDPLGECPPTDYQSMVTEPSSPGSSSFTSGAHYAPRTAHGFPSNLTSAYGGNVQNDSASSLADPHLAFSATHHINFRSSSLSAVRLRLHCSLGGLDY
jgi:hypothetical protein